MNWLAHLFLSHPSPEFRIGNLLPDLAPISSWRALEGDFRAGAQCHIEIDRFTDSHPVVRRSILRFRPQFRRFGGVLVDVFYDHFLAARWTDYSSTSLEAFTSEIYGSFSLPHPELLSETAARLKQMAAGDLLCSYRHFSGIRAAVRRIDARLRKPAGLEDSLQEFEQHYTDFSNDFAEFFPELRAHVGPLIAARGNA